MANDSTIFNFNDNSWKLINAQKQFCITKLEPILSRRICNFEFLSSYLNPISSANDVISIISEIILKLFKNMEANLHKNSKIERDTYSSNNNNNTLYHKLSENIEKKKMKVDNVTDRNTNKRNKYIESSSGIFSKENQSLNQNKLKNPNPNLKKR